MVFSGIGEGTSILALITFWEHPLNQIRSAAGIKRAFSSLASDLETLHSVLHTLEPCVKTLDSNTAAIFEKGVEDTMYTCRRLEKLVRVEGYHIGKN
jgi:hypothetical protein